MISTKRGTTDYLILVTVTMIIAVVGIATSVIIGTELLDSSETSQSFESLVFNLENLESGISNTTLFNLHEGYYLVSFNNGGDFEGTEKPCKEEITVPQDLCENSPCLCLCKGPFFSIISDLEDICIDDPIACNKFSDSELSFLDKTCPSNGVLREGEEDAVVFVSYERLDNTIYFCEDNACVTVKEQLLASNFEEEIETYESCLQNTGDSKCELDLDFLGEESGFNIYPSKIELIDLSTKSILSSHSIETKITHVAEFSNELAGAEAFTLYSVEITEVVGVGDVIDTETNTYTYLSPFINGDLNKNVQIRVSPTLLVKDSQMVIVPYDYDFSNVQEDEAFV
ncbi:hypothetical protein HN840_05315 [archaeon]|nr:hypothetical protein [archaeon]MBT7281714.1 hypothetical protein [archaeon]